MKRVTSSIEKGFSLPRRVWPSSLTAGLLLTGLAVLFSWSTFASPQVFAASQATFANFSTSPSQGPVGAVIAVNITSLNFANGTKVQLGETPAFSSGCTLASDSQNGTVQSQSFSGWLRWPTSTGTGWFQVCARVGKTVVLPNFSGFYHVLSATPPQVTVAPTAPTVSKQATVSGTNFLPAGTSVNLLWQAAGGGQTLSLGTATSDSTGAFTQTFTVPAKASVGSYMVTATVGSKQPATLSASITFHVNGITIAVVPTPSIQSAPTPTASPTSPIKATATARPTTPASQSTKSNDLGKVPVNTNLLLPLMSGGLLLIVAALVAGVLFVHRQRELIALSGASKPAWSAALAMSLSATFPMSAVSRLSGSTGKMIAARNAHVPHEPSMQDLSAIPFDPVLAEAMRQAQVSLFATPRPPMDEKAPF